MSGWADPRSLVPQLRDLRQQSQDSVLPPNWSPELVI